MVVQDPGTASISPQKMSAKKGPFIFKDIGHSVSHNNPMQNNIAFGHRAVPYSDDRVSSHQGLHHGLICTN